MWRLPNGRTINSPRGIQIDGINHPADIFYRWSLAELNAVGIYPFVEAGYNSKYYRSTGKTDKEIDGTIFRTHTLENRFTGVELRSQFVDGAKLRLRQLWSYANGELEYLEAFDAGNTIDIDEWQQYKMFLKAAFIQAKAELQEITNYEDGIEFIEHGFNALLPDRPDEIDIN